MSLLLPSAPLLPPNRRVRPKRPPKSDTVVEAGPVLDQDHPTSPSGCEVSRAQAGAGSSTRRAVATAAVTVVLASLCVWGLVRYTRTSPRFAIRNLEIQGTIHATPADLGKLGGIEIGANIFGLDVEVSRARVLQNPWIERVSVSRRLPGTVRVDVVEREPAAIVALGAQLYFATREGEPFKRVEGGDPSDLPIITGIGLEQVTRDRAGAVATIRRALDLAAEYERVPPARTLPIQEVHADEDGTLMLVVGKDPVVLHMGRGPYRQPLEQATRVLAEVASRHAQAGTVFLDNEAHPERVVVRMR
jgi:cell division protein FtsQ